MYPFHEGAGKNRLVLGFDITDSTKHDTHWWVDMRELLLPAVFRAVRNAGVHRWEYAFRDAGDGGAIVFKHPQYQAASAINQIIPDTLSAVHYRRPVGLQEPLRMRFAVDRGSVARDAWGYVGEGVFHMFQMLGSEELVARHARTGAAATLTVSESVSEELNNTPGFVMPPGVLILNPQTVTKRPPSDEYLATGASK